MACRQPEQTKTVIICPACGGHGFTVHDELIDYHKGHYVHEAIGCKDCNSTGRQIMYQTLDYEPYSEETKPGDKWYNFK